jgi:hypothetical protein
MTTIIKSGQLGKSASDISLPLLLKNRDYIRNLTKYFRILSKLEVKVWSYLVTGGTTTDTKPG